MGMNLSIGAVGFAKPSTKNSAGYAITDHIGDERVRLLQLVRDGKPLPDPLFLVGQTSGGAWERITAEDINWETSRIKPSRTDSAVAIMRRWRELRDRLEQIDQVGEKLVGKGIVLQSPEHYVSGLGTVFTTDLNRAFRFKDADQAKEVLDAFTDVLPDFVIVGL